MPKKGLGFPLVALQNHQKTWLTLEGEQKKHFLAVKENFPLNHNKQKCKCFPTTTMKRGTNSSLRDALRVPCGAGRLHGPHAGCLWDRPKQEDRCLSRV